MLDELKAGRKTVGAKETFKALKNGRIRVLFAANDADKKLVEPLLSICKKTGITVQSVDSMKELGALCGIDVGSAVAGLLK